MATIRPRTTSGTTTAIEYTDVIVIGNGPSGICLSYLLSGNTPYYTGTGHPNEYLHYRLQTNPDQSLLEQDLEFLASGLEGRSSNPLALLFDALTHPDADMGMDTSSLLTWKHEKEQEVPHIVLGKANIGGTWQMMEGSMQTLSLGNWMQLPDLPFKEWLEKRRIEQESNEVESASASLRNRASIQDVRVYYEDYVRQKGLEKKFRSHTTVTSVLRVLDVCHSVDEESGEQNPCSRDHCGKFKWEVTGYETLIPYDNESVSSSGSCEDEEPLQHFFCYRAPNVVLATGTNDLPNRLTDAGGTHHPYVLHSYPALEAALKNGSVMPDSDPIMVIGAGLTAADAILLIQAHKVPVVHLFRREPDDPNLIFNKLPKMLYPEYHSVLQMMRSPPGSVEGYTPYPRHQVIELMQDGQVLIRGTEAAVDSIIRTSNVAVLIGSRPDLSFLPHEGKHLGVVPGMRIDSKHNPIDVDPITHQSHHECGLYAMGPLVGDNFVRFLRGGALGIAADILRKQDKSKM